jgi:ribonuclease HIII
MLGDLSTAPEALFEVLGAATDHLALESFDTEALHRTRIGKQTRIEGALAMLRAFGWDRLPQDLGSELQQIAAVLIDRAGEYQGFGLFVDAETNGYLLGLKVSLDGAGGVRPFVRVDDDLAHEASVALALALEGRGGRWDIEWPLSFEGRSIGIALYIAGLVANQTLKPDPLLAATGQIDVNERVLPVGGIEAKLNAALAAGIRRVVLPEANRVQAEAHPASKEMDLVFVSNVAEILPQLNRATAATQIGFDGMVRFIRNLMPLYGVELADERAFPNFARFDVTDARTRANMDVYHTRKLVVGGSQGTARNALERLKSEHFDSRQPQPRSTQTFKVLTEARQERLHKSLIEAGASVEVARQDELWRYRLVDGSSQAVVVLYRTGTCLVPGGTAPAFDRIVSLVTDALGGLANANSSGSSHPSGNPSTASSEVDESRPHIGTDEAGKGDFFGPLVSAAVFVANRSMIERLRALGVKDSKLLSDTVVRKLAAEIRTVLGRRASVVQLPPKTFNELYRQMRSEGKNLNTLLAWAHARSIENLIGAGAKADFVVVDKFADASYIERKILADTRETGIPIIQVTKAETHTAVAAASILARDAFLAWLDEQSTQLGWRIPKGASDQVVAAGKRLVEQHGKDALREYAKISFRTIERVLGP